MVGLSAKRVMICASTTPMLGAPPDSSLLRPDCLYATSKLMICTGIVELFFAILRHSGHRVRHSLQFCGRLNRSPLLPFAIEELQL
jgi:hypothetical protein